MNIFFTPDITGNQYSLSEEESKHCIRVLRHSKGDILTLVDGTGGWYLSEIIDANPKKCLVRVTEKKINFEKRNYHLHIAIAPTKNIERMEWFLEKATEIGVDEITPLLCEHSERKQIKTDRLEKVMISAMKQSLKAYLPRLNNLTTFDSFVKQGNAVEHLANPNLRFIAHCNEVEKMNLFEAAKPSASILVLIGPEGDFSSSEIETALKNEFREISLGKSRLRTETAGIVAVQMINLLNEK